MRYPEPQVEVSIWEFGVGAVKSAGIEKQFRLTANDKRLFTRIAYAMVLTGLWHSVARRVEMSFDYFEIYRQEGHAAYRVGRLSCGGYVGLNLGTGTRAHGISLAPVLREIAYVPRTLEGL